jgi:chemotaxis protein CheY-P-specific phosphatase CheC
VLEVLVSIVLRDPLDDPALLAAFASGLEGAAASCEAMSGGRLHVSSSEIRRLTAADVLVSAGGAEVPVAAVYVGFSGRLSGHAVLMLPAGEGRSLAKIVLGGLTDGSDVGTASIETAGMTTLERSALEEIANVAVSAVLNRLGDHLGEAIHPQVPVFVHDMAGAVLDAIVSDAAGIDETLFAARTRFSQDAQDATGVLLVVPAAHP